jgi:hypothetical protein
LKLHKLLERKKLKKAKHHDVVDGRDKQLNNTTPTKHNSRSEQYIPVYDLISIKEYL